MKTVGISLAVFLFFTSLAFSQETKTTAAVIDLEVKEGVSSGVASMLSDYLRTQLVNTNKFTIVTRENMEQVLKEQKFQLSGCTSQECVVQMGQLLGVRKMFTGSIGKIGATHIINLKIINIENGKIERAETEQCLNCKEDALLVSVENIAYKIISVPKPKKEEKGKGKGIIKISSAPAGADVYVNTDYKGKTPVTTEVNEGSNEIALYRQGYISVVKTIEIKAKEEKIIEISLEEQRATLFLSIDQREFKLKIDGEDKGVITSNNTQYSLFIGKHTIEIEKENYFPYKKEVVVEYPKTEVQITLNPKPGNLLVITSPENADVYIDGNQRGKSPLTIKNVSAGSHKVKAIYKEYYTEEEIMIPPGGSKSISLNIDIEGKKAEESRYEQKKKWEEEIGEGAIGFTMGYSYLSGGTYTWTDQYEEAIYTLTGGGYYIQYSGLVRSSNKDVHPWVKFSVGLLHYPQLQGIRKRGRYGDDFMWHIYDIRSISENIFSLEATVEGAYDFSDCFRPYIGIGNNLCMFLGENFSSYSVFLSCGILIRPCKTYSFDLNYRYTCFGSIINFAISYWW